MCFFAAECPGSTYWQETLYALFPAIFPFGTLTSISGIRCIFWGEPEEVGRERSWAVLMENRNGLPVGAAITRATGTAEREAVLALLDRRRADQHITFGADKAYDVTAFVKVFARVT